jgi:hypothetical protein
MSTLSTIGAGIVGAVATVAGIVAVETRPAPPSAIVICEDYVPLPGEALLAARGCCLDGRAVRVIVAGSSELQAP